MRAKLLLGTAFAVFPLGADAASITVTFPEYNATANQAGAPYPLPAVTVGTFLVDIPAGEIVVAASIEGTYGDSRSGRRKFYLRSLATSDKAISVEPE